MTAAAAFGLLPASAHSDENNPPVISYSIDGIVGTNGWYRGSLAGAFVTLHWKVESTGDTTTKGCNSIKINAPETGTTRTCTATNSAGTTAVTTKVIRVDADVPTLLAPAPWRGPDANGWYNHAFNVGWSGSDKTSGIASCTVLTYAGPDSANAAVQGTCTDVAGNSAAPRAFAFKYDGSPPVGVAPSPDRAPDSNGWYNHAVAIAWHGSDALSGLAACTALTYSGPDSGNAAVSGSCTDVAGNVSPAVAFALRYDHTPPAWKSLKARGENGKIVLAWRTSGGVSARVTRSPGEHGTTPSVVYSGQAQRFVDRRVRQGVHYRYTVDVVDAAGNPAIRTAVGIAKAALLFAPADGARLRAPRALAFAWQAKRGAAFYNIQLWRNGRKVGTFWPNRPRLLLRSPWSSVGGTHRFVPGRYTWFVWPGFGRRSGGRYGPLLGMSSFVITR